MTGHGVTMTAAPVAHSRTPRTPEFVIPLDHGGFGSPRTIWQLHIWEVSFVHHRHCQESGNALYTDSPIALSATLPSTYQANTGDQPPCLDFVVLAAPPLACGVMYSSELPELGRIVIVMYSYLSASQVAAKALYRITCHVAPHGDRVSSWDKLDNCSPSRSPIVRTIVGLIN
jgi:hypothetical protein